MDKPVIIFGANDIGKAALDIFMANGVEVYGFLDADEALHGQQVGDVTILGRPDDHGFLKLVGHKAEAFVAADDRADRQEMVDLLIEQRKMMPVNAIHPSAVISPAATFHHGAFVGAGVVVGHGASVGNHVLLHPGATVGVGAVLSDHVQVGAGATINARVQLGEGVFVGSGATVVAGVSVGKDARIGAGSVVVADVKKGETVFGNPAQAVKP